MCDAAGEHILRVCIHVTYCREARSEPGYVQYYYANVKQNPRLPPPLSRLGYSGSTAGDTNTWNAPSSPRTFGVSDTTDEPRTSGIDPADGSTNVSSPTSQRVPTSKGSEGGTFHSIFSAPQTPQTPLDQAGVTPFTTSTDTWSAIDITTKEAGPQQQSQPQPIGSVPGSPVRAMRVRTSKSIGALDAMDELSQSSSPKSPFASQASDAMTDNTFAKALSAMGLDSDTPKSTTLDDKHTDSPLHPLQSRQQVGAERAPDRDTFDTGGIHDPQSLSSVGGGHRNKSKPQSSMHASGSPYAHADSQKSFHGVGASYDNQYPGASASNQDNSMYTGYVTGTAIPQINPTSHMHAVYPHGVPHFTAAGPESAILAASQRSSLSQHPPSQSPMPPLHGGLYGSVPAGMRPGASGQMNPYGTDAYTAYCIRFAEAQLAAMAVVGDPSAAASVAAAMGHYPPPGDTAAAAAAAAVAMSNSFRHGENHGAYDHQIRGNGIGSYGEAALGPGGVSLSQGAFRVGGLKGVGNGGGYSNLGAASRDERIGSSKYGEKSRRSGNGVGDSTRTDMHTSSFLEEFKSGKGRRLELQDVTGHVIEFSMDQHGSRFIQQKLETAEREHFDLIFHEALPQCMTLMTDVFGNYVVQKLLEHGTDEAREQLCQKMNGHVVNLSLQMYGCRVTQKAIEVLRGPQQQQLVRELDGHVHRCVRDQNGNHVIQKCIEHVASEDIAFIFDTFTGNIAELAVHPYGCRVVQRIREHCTDEARSSEVIEEIIEATVDLAKDQYGNYVVQHVLLYGTPDAKFQVVRKLQDIVVSMSQHKFASNVVEKMLIHAARKQKNAIIESLMSATEDPDFMLQMLRDQFANYVIQKLLDICSDEQRSILLDRIGFHLHALKKYTYSKHIVARFEKLRADAGSSITSRPR